MSLKILEDYYNSGKIMYRFTKKNEKKHGPSRWWYENGQLGYEWFWKDGKLHGPNRDWNKDGKLTYEIYWWNDVRITKKEYKIKLNPYRKLDLLKRIKCILEE